MRPPTNRSRRAARTALVLGLAMLIGGWPEVSLARTITIVRAQTAKAMGGVPLRRIALMPFRGQAAGDVAAALATELSAVQSAGKPYFNLTQAASLSAARAQAAEGMISADVQLRIDEEAYQGLGYGCIQSDGAGGCARMGLTTPNCARRVLQLTVTPKLIRLADGEVLYSTPKSSKGTVAWCQGQPAPSSNQPALEQALKSIVSDLRRDLAPTDQKVRLTIKDSDRALPKERRDALRQAVRAMSENLVSACSMLQQLDGVAPQDPSVIFDLAVCAETSGDLVAAQRGYQMAQSLNPAGDRDVADANTRISAALAEQAETARQQEAVRAVQAAELRRQAQEEAAQRATQAAEARRQGLATADRQRQMRAEAQARQAAADARVRDAKKKYGADVGEAVVQARVQKGMTTQQVIAAKGQPTRRENLGGGDAQWYYPGLRVIFTAGRVTYVGS